MKQHLVLVLNSAYQSDKTGQTEYQKMVIDDSVLDFLENFANIEKAVNLNKIYVINNIKLQYLGVVSEGKPSANEDAELKEKPTEEETSLEVVDDKPSEAQVQKEVENAQKKKKRPARRTRGSGTGPR